MTPLDFYWKLSQTLNLFKIINFGKSYQIIFVTREQKDYSFEI